MESLVEQARVTVPVEIVPIMRKDSLELTDDDRANIAAAVLNSKAQRVVVTHGTDTMTKTAAQIESDLDAAGLAKVVVLTGAFAPARFAMTDAIFNVGLAFGAVQTLDSGVYIAMSGQIFKARDVKKNLEAQRFETV